MFGVFKENWIYVYFFHAKRWTQFLCQLFSYVFELYTSSWSIKNTITRQVEPAFMLKDQAVSAWLWLEYHELFVLPLHLTCSLTRGNWFVWCFQGHFFFSLRRNVSTLYLFWYVKEDPIGSSFTLLKILCL